MFILQLLKNAPTCFDRHSDHPRGARIFLIKITAFKICQKYKKLVCRYAGLGPAYRHTSKHSAPAHTICYAATSPQ